MDWALKAARRKFKNQSGGSRSIVESLNDFNKAMLKGHTEAEHIFYRGSEWINNEMTSLGFDMRDLAAVGPVSPEKSIAIDDDDDELERDHKIETRNGQPATGDPSVVEETSKSENRRLERVEEVQVQEREREQVRDSRPDGELSVSTQLRHSNELGTEEIQDNNNTNFHQQLAVQPAITPKSLLGDDTGRLLINSSSFKKVKEHPSTKSSPWPVPKEGVTDVIPAAEVNLPVTRENTGIIELNVSSSIVTEEKGRSDSVIKVIRDRSQRRSNMFVPLPSKDPLIVQPTPNHHKRNADFSVPATAQKDKRQKSRQLNLPTSSGELKSRSPHRGGNVFERLSNNLTESFERKASDRRAGSPIRNKRSTSSPTRTQRSAASIHGSPTSRKSSHNSTHADQIHHTLKNIFDSRIPQLPKGRNESLPLQRRLSNIIDRSKSTERKSLIPRVKQLGTLKDRKELVSQRTAEIITTKKDVPSRTAVSIPLDPVNTSRTSPSVSPTSSEHKINAQDRLTKFQLNSGVSTNRQEKHVLKQKLNKRLSEVMRNQQEQQLRKRYELQQRRVSQAEDETNRRTKILLDNSNSSTSTLNKPRTVSSVLHDVNTVDYREMIGVKSNLGVIDTDVSLPDIPSDDDDSPSGNPERILESWAEPNVLKQQLLLQQHWNIEQVLGPIPTLHVDEIFHSNPSRLQKLKKR